MCTHYFDNVLAFQINPAIIWCILSVLVYSIGSCRYFLTSKQFCIHPPYWSSSALNVDFKMYSNLCNGFKHDLHGGSIAPWWCESEARGPRGWSVSRCGQTGRARRRRGGRHRWSCPRPAARPCVLLMTVSPARRRIISKIAEIRRPGIQSGPALLFNIISVHYPPLDCRKIVP